MDQRIIALFNLLLRIFELRFLGAGGRRLSVFASVPPVAQEALRHPETSKLNAYIVTNPSRLDAAALLARGVKLDVVFQPRYGQCTKDADVSERIVLACDFDPARAVGTASTPEQRALAMQAALAMVAYLAILGWELLALLDSGNGVHCYFRTHLENCRETDALLASLYFLLGKKFGSASVIFDTSVRNPSRVMRLPGSMNHKAGRVCEFITFHENAKPVTLAQIENVTEALRKELGVKARKTSLVISTRRGAWTAELVEAFFEFHEIAYTIPIEKTQGLFWMIECPFNPDHEPGSACVFLTPAGFPRFKCLHNTCKNPTWKKLVAYLNRTNGKVFPWKSVKRKSSVSK